MWKQRIQERYPWAEIHDKLDELLLELSKAEDEEDVELSLLSLHLSHRIDLSFFTEKEQKQIKDSLNILIEDTKKHCQFLAACILEMKSAKQYFLEKEKEKEKEHEA